MARRRKRGRSKKHGKGLSGVAKVGENSYVITAKEAALMLLAAIAAGGAGAAIGKHSLLVGLPITVIGIHKKNKYVTAAGLGFTLSNGFQNKSNAIPETTDGLGNIKQLAEQAKDRVTTFFKNFGEKLYLPKSITETTNGLGENGVTYFVNPYSKKELDMSAIDHIQEQIAQMNKSDSGQDQIEREF